MILSDPSRRGNREMQESMRRVWTARAAVLLYTIIVTAALGGVLSLTPGLGVGQTSQSSKAVQVVKDDLKFKVTTLPEGLVGRRYSFSIEPVGGTPPYKMSLQSGVLPSGLALSERIVGIEGEPAQSGRSELKIRVVDSKGKSGTFSGQISIWRALTVGENGTFKGFDGLQMALNMALDMDEIRIQKGVYKGSGLVVPQGKSWQNGIRITGGWDETFSDKSNDPEATVFDGNGSASRILSVLQAKGAISIENLRFTNSTGGAVDVRPWSATHGFTFIRCSFDNNSADDGGAVAGGTTFTECTFTNNVATGYGASGGAVSAGANVTFTNCTFADNKANGYGGAVRSSAATFISCTFSRNSAGGRGGAVETGGRATFRSCVFADNAASGEGGAVSVGGGTFVDCTFTGNTAKETGGGVSGSGTFDNCRFVNNSTTGPGLFLDPGGRGGAVEGIGKFSKCTFTGNSALFGGAVYGLGSTFSECAFYKNTASWGGAVHGGKFSNCMFTGNSASCNGGAVSGGGSFANCLFAENAAGEAGGAFTDKGAHHYWTPGGPGELINCTFYANKAATEGGAIDGSDVQVLNCIFLNNVANGKSNDIAAKDRSQVDYSFVRYISGVANIGPHNIITGDPRFTDPDKGDFTLRNDSPCINAGKDVPKHFPPGSLDLAGKPRVVGGKIDMGAYEWQGR